MELLLIIGGIWLVIWAAQKAINSRRDSQRVNRPTRDRNPPPAKRADVYRPKSSKPGRPTITFQPIKGGNTSIPSGDALDGLHDAFTGAPINARLGLHQCSKCTVYYHSESVAVLREENGARCVACGNSSIVPITETQARATKGRDYNPNVVTLANFRKHFDRVVTFEGRVHAVKVSRRGTDYAVMLENASWTKGLKLVFFRGAVRAVGGPEFINSMNGRTVRVRGLLINHNRFGPEIIISERGMILGVTS